MNAEAQRRSDTILRNHSDNGDAAFKESGRPRPESYNPRGEGAPAP